MYSNLRSLIFKIDPERAHFLAIQSLKLNLVSNIFDENKNDPILKTELFNKDLDRKSTRLNSSHVRTSRMPSSA